MTKEAETFIYPEPAKAEFNTAAYAQGLYKDMEHEIRNTPAFRSRSTSELARDVE